MLLRCRTATLLLLVAGCAQCLNETLDDCWKSACEFHTDVDGERHTTRVVVETIFGIHIAYVIRFTSVTLIAKDTVVSVVDVHSRYPSTKDLTPRERLQREFPWIINTPFVKDFWSGDWDFALILIVHVYNMSLNQTYVSSLQARRLRQLQLTGNSWPSTSELTLDLPLLRKLSLAGNEIETLHQGLLVECPNLHQLDLSRNKITSYWNVLDSLAPIRKQLKELNLATNFIRELYSDSTALSIVGWNLEKLNLSHNQINSLYLKGIWNVSKVDLSFNNLTAFGGHLYPFWVDRVVLAGQNISTLSEVAAILSSIDSGMFQHVSNIVYETRSTVEVLYVPQSQCTVDWSVVYCKQHGFDIDIFISKDSTFINLRLTPIKIDGSLVSELCVDDLLDLSENNLKVLNDVPAQISRTKQLNLPRNSISYISRHFFENMTLLKVVDLSYNQLQHVQLILYSSLRVLDMSNNNLNRMNILQFSPQYTIEYLNLSHNNFTAILETEWSQFKHFSKVDLGGNNFECCSPEGQHSRSHFLIYQHKILNLNSSKALTCVRPHYGRVEMTNAWLNGDHCQINVEGWVAFGCLLILLPLIIHIAELLDYFIHQAERDLAERLTRLKNQGLEEDENCAPECQYDAFVCHSHKDAGWVRRELVPNLENVKDGQRLCIHYRDFQLGSFIEENVEKAMNSSRKVIVVVTRSFLKSNWCKMELTFAWEKMVREGRNYIIVIEVDRIPKDKRPPILSHLMRSRTYLEWPEAPTDDEKQECWSRVRDALGKSLRDRGITAFQIDCEDV